MKLVQDPSWGQHGRFWTPSRPPKLSQNRGFWESKRELMLREPKIAKFGSRLGENTIFTPSGYSRTLPKSNVNGCQQAFMLRLVSDIFKYRLWSVPEPLWGRKKTKNYDFWSHLGPQDGTKIGPETDLGGTLPLKCPHKSPGNNQMAPQSRPDPPNHPQKLQNEVQNDTPNEPAKALK